MKLPGAKDAFIDARKRRDYCLNPKHPRGKHKARMFEVTLGLTRADASQLHTLLLEAAQTYDAAPARADEHGQRYVLDFSAQTPRGSAVIRAVWIVRPHETFLRLVTCHVL